MLKELTSDAMRLKVFVLSLTLIFSSLDLLLIGLGCSPKSTDSVDELAFSLSSFEFLRDTLLEDVVEDLLDLC